MSNPHVLREYALLADGRRGALIGPDGDIAWLCLPDWDSPAVFASLLGSGGGFSVTPLSRHVWGGYYEPGSLIWHSRWVTESGIVECREALVFPGAPDHAVLLRRVHAIEGAARVAVSCALADDYGRRRGDVPRLEDGVWRGRAGEVVFSLAGLPDATPRDEEELSGELTLEPGRTHDLVLVLARGHAGPDAGQIDPDRAWEATETAWAERVPAPTVRTAARDAWQARAVLRGLTRPGAGMVAAATMSLPERADAGRSYDYRYAWVRDQAIVGQAAAAAEAFDLLDDATGFLGARLLEDGSQLAPAYTAGGGHVPDQRSLGLPGYPGGADISGNHANAQFQLDAFGEVLLCLAAADRAGRLDVDGWRAAEIAADAIAARHREPGAGIWELSPARWTHSRLVCAAGLRALAARPGAGSRAGNWMSLAETLLAGASVDLAPDGHWFRAPEDSRVDGALVLAIVRGAVPIDDPRARATLAAVEAELCDDGYSYRYQPDARPLGEAEGAFLLCGFAMALAAQASGREVAARHYFERNRSACGSPGLFSEEYDVGERQLRGNLPQAFVHALLLECAAVLPDSSIVTTERTPR